jgi:hypothetical protein
MPKYLPETFEALLKRFPMLGVVLTDISCPEQDREFLKSLFLQVYCGGYEDGSQHVT